MTTDTPIPTPTLVKLQTSVLPATQEYLRLESLRRHLTMGQLIDEWVQSLVPESTS